MKWIKHFTDAHEGTLMQLFDDMGHAGPCCYWILVELCGKKLEKEQHEAFTEEDFVFTFHERILREKFRLSGAKVERWFNLGSTLNLFRAEKIGKEFRISFPKLLECLDRDSKRARQRRDESASPPRLEESRGDLIVVGDQATPSDFEAIQVAYPKPGDRAEGLKRATELVRKSEVPLLAKAAAHYTALMRKLKMPIERIRSFPNFIEYKNEQFWRKFIDRPLALDTPSAASAGPAPSVVLDPVIEKWAVWLTSMLGVPGGRDIAFEHVPSGLHTVLETSWGTWASLPTDHAARAVRIALAEFEYLMPGEQGRSA